jgi:hypothetical protein
MVNNAFAANLPRTSTRSLPSGTIVSQVRIAGTNVHVFSAWSKSAAGLIFAGRGFSTVTHFGDECFGRIGTERIPAEVEALQAGSERRSIAVRSWYGERKAVAVAAIFEAFPELVEAGARVDLSMGEVELTVEGN